MTNVPDIFASQVFNDAVMKTRLPNDVYKALRRTISLGKHLNLDIANVVASAMKEWAVEKGATHFTHWFQPMTGAAAEKHDGFISPESDGTVIMEFSGKELVRGEPDASSFPSGGLRATFEARGYTAWDPTSYAFVRDGTLYIPTAFCSYTGEALDKKTPLLRSMQAIDIQAKRILKLFGKEAKHVDTTVGAEQEYFLIDKSVYLKRPDLVYCGRTLFGAPPPKGQELEDHYFASIKPRVAEFMRDLDEQLWRFGIVAKTKHNEVAPAQHELAPVFTSINIAADHNQLTMDLMKAIADKHGMVCLLHEKPFSGINGSGKHNNWSISADGVNLLDPGETPADNAQFLLFLAALIAAVDDYQDLVRVSAASAGNDHRLGASEAPPAIVSIFLGEELTEILSRLVNNREYKGKGRVLMEIGAAVLPHFPKDNTDRNRTSPFAFTGNKFEFRMLGSSASVSEPNVVLNTIVAEELSRFADILEESPDFNNGLKAVIVSTINEHRRIIFNGDGYSKEWEEEAARRGLLNLRTTPEALKTLLDEKNIALFKKHGVFSETELRSRHEVMLENYSKVIRIEARTMIEMAKKYAIPAGIRWQKELADAIAALKAAEAPVPDNEKNLLAAASSLINEIMARLSILESAADCSRNFTSAQDEADFAREEIFSAMEALRVPVDRLEQIVPPALWVLPSCGEILSSAD